MNAQAHGRYVEQRTGLASREQAKAYLADISNTTLWRLVRRGDLECVRIGRRVCFRWADLDALVERNREATP